MKYLFSAWLKKCTSEKNNQGFTLIELLVVIIIIGILSTIALPSFLRMINLGQEVEAKNFLSYIAKLQHQYHTEQGKFSSSTESLGSSLPNETENYSYFVFADNNNLKGAIHIAQSKNNVLKSYIKVMYQKDQEPKECNFKEVDLSFPPLIIFDAVSNPNKYCPN